MLIELIQKPRAQRGFLFYVKNECNMLPMKKLIPVLICLFALSCTPKSEKKRNPPVSDDEETESGEWNDKAVAERDKGNYVMAKYYNRKAISYENVCDSHITH